MSLSNKIICFGILNIAFSSMSIAATTEDCNEKVRLQIFESAKEKCVGKFKDVFWSEKELDVSADGKTISAGFSFRCKTGKRYLGLIKISVPPSCEVSKVETSHTSIVPTKSLVQ